MDLENKELLNDLVDLVRKGIELQLLKMEKQIQDKDEYILTILKAPIKFDKFQVCTFEGKKVVFGLQAYALLIDMS